MSLRTQILLFVVGVSALYASATFVVQSSIMIPSFAEVEHHEAIDDVSRCVQALERDAEFVSTCANDYGAWDDTYQFVLDGNEEYKTANLVPDTFKNLKLELIAFVRNDGTLAWGEVRRNDGKDGVDAPGLLAAIVKPSARLTGHKTPDSKVHGVYMSELGPMLVGSAAITTSNRDGAVRGSVVMGRFVTKETILELSQRTRVAVQVFPVSEAAGEDAVAMREIGSEDDVRTVEMGPDVLRGYAVIRDVASQPALLLRADMPRAIVQRGRAAVNAAAWASVGAGAISLIVMWWALTRMIVRPLMRVTQHAVRVGSRDDLAARLDMPARDEIGIMAREFDRMVDRLAESRAQMVSVARKAGKAEVAVSVLHNVGNVLNSVNVSAGVVSDRIRRSEVATLGIAANMLKEHRDKLAEFLTGDERGRQLPQFLVELSGQLANEQTEMLSEMESLKTSIDHIRNIVAMQQEHGRAKTVIESVEPSAVLEQALALVSESVARHGVQVERDVRVSGPVQIDRHRTLQIVVNLLTNGIQAIKASGQAERKLGVRMMRRNAGDGEGDALVIQVRDNGIGIEPGNLERVFGLGFSTRPDGNGIGLHGSANLAREMGGSLTAASEGIGRGAEFTLSVPLVGREALV